MAEKALPRLTRLLGIVTFLEQQGEKSFDVLADHFGVTTAQIRKDVDTLWVSGLPGYMTDDLIDFDAAAFEEGIASLTNSQGVTQVRLSAREAVALVGALSSLVAAGSAPAAAATALSKLREALGGNEPVTVVAREHTDPHISTSLWDAVARRRVARVTYVDAHDRRTQRDIEPHRLVSIDGVSYVECFCRRAQDYRTLRLDRISEVKVTDVAVVAQPSDADGFSLAPRFNATVVVARGARWAFEDLPGATVEDSGDDVVVTFGVADVDWVASRLLSVAPLIRTMEPAALRDTLAAHARAVLAAQAE
jgi:proteasome accessory factor C